MKLKEKTKAVQLRKRGYSYSDILKEVSVSKGTLSLWLRDIKLTPEQERNIYAEFRQKNAYRLAKINQKRRIDITKKIIKTAKIEAISNIQDPLFLAGLMLYWAEGDKSEQHEHVKFSNSDPDMVKVMMRWFRDKCQVPEEKFRIAVHIHELHCREDVEKYWSQVTRIPICQFHKTQIKKTSLRHRKNRLYNGTCNVRIYNKDLFRRIKGWKISCQESLKDN